jgi:hypothetical protein
MKLDPSTILAICAVLTLSGSILVGIFMILWELKKNTLLTEQILGRVDTTEKKVEDLNGRVIILESQDRQLKTRAI